MIPIDIIVCINNFTTNINIRSLDKEIYKEVIMSEKSRNWYNIYSSYFIQNNIRIPSLDYSCAYNWKEEYSRIKNYLWNLFNYGAILGTRI